MSFTKEQIDGMVRDADYIRTATGERRLAAIVFGLDDVCCHIKALACEVERLQRYERAIKSMADQFVCPKTTAEEMVKSILGE
jgi:hypothetical protein